MPSAARSRPCHAGVQHAVLGQAPFRGGIAVGHRGFRAFLVVQHEVEREPRAARPFRVGRIGAVADQVSVHGGQIALIGARWPLVDWLVIRAEKPRMSAAATSWILSEGYAGLQAQALGLAEAAGLRARAARAGAARAVEVGDRVALAGAAGRGAGRGAGAAAGAGDRLRRHGGGGRRGAAPGRPAGRAGAAPAHGPAPLRPDRGQPARRADRAERRGDAHRAAPRHAGAAGRGGRGVAPAASRT